MDRSEVESPVRAAAVMESLECRRLLSATVDFELVDVDLSPDVIEAQAQIGTALATQGSQVLVGNPNFTHDGQQHAGEAYLVDTATEDRILIENPDAPAGGPEQFGFRVAFTGEDRVVIGAPHATPGEPGLAYVFDVSGAEAVLVATLENPLPSSSDSFGSQVAGFDDDHVLVMASQPGLGSIVHLINLSDPEDPFVVATLEAQTGAPDGFGIAMAVSGSQVLIGAPGAVEAVDAGDDRIGAVYLYEADVTAGTVDLVHTFVNPNELAAGFGQAVAFDGSDILIGAPLTAVNGVGGAGAAYRYAGAGLDLSGGVTDEATPKYLHPDADPDGDTPAARFGSSIAVSGDKVLIGASFDPIEFEVFPGLVLELAVGGAYLFDAESGDHLGTIENPEPNPLPPDQFGLNVAPLAGGRFAVAAPDHNIVEDDDVIERAGKVYVYQMLLENGEPELPAIVAVEAPAEGVRQQRLDFTGVLDGDLNGVQQVSWDFGDGSELHLVPGVDADVLSVSHVYTSLGTFEVSLTLHDEDGPYDSQSVNVTIVAAGLQVNEDGDLDLYVGGAPDASNTIHIQPDSGGGIRVNMNGVKSVFNPTGRVVVFGGEEHDTLIVSTQVTLPAELYGISGNNTLRGGGGDTIIVGGDGSDQIIGGEGRSLLIGGKGADRIIGRKADDILIAGHTLHDDDPEALRAILAEWTSERDYVDRVRNIRNGLNDGSEPDADRLNGDFFLTPNETVFHDGERNVLRDRHGQNWFLFNGDTDQVVGLEDDEFADMLELMEIEGIDDPIE